VEVGKSHHREQTLQNTDQVHDGQLDNKNKMFQRASHQRIKKNKGHPQ